MDAVEDYLEEGLTGDELDDMLAEVKAAGLLLESSGNLVTGLVSGDFKPEDGLILVTQKVFDTSAAQRISTNILGQFIGVLDKGEKNGFGWIRAFLERYCYQIEETAFVNDMPKKHYLLLERIMSGLPLE